MANLTKPPGQQLMKRMSARTKWLLLAPTGVLLVGAGLCVCIDAAFDMHGTAPFSRWFLKGTYGLILFNGGLSLFGTGMRFRAMLDTRQIIRQELKRRQKELKRYAKKASPTKDGNTIGP
jgi:hypothetical protein